MIGGSGLRTPGEPRAPARALRDPEALAGRDPGDPGDLACRDDHRQVGAAGTGHAAVGEEVLERAAAGGAERVHAVAGAPRADVERRGQRLEVERAVAER